MIENLTSVPIILPLQLKQNQKVDPLRPKRMFELFKNDFQTTLKMSIFNPQIRTSTNQPIHPLANHQTNNPGDVLSTCARASRDPRGELQVRVAKSIRYGKQRV